MPAEQMPADTLRQATVNLAVHDHGIHHTSHIVDGGHPHDLRQTGFRIDFDFGDITTVRESIVCLDSFAESNATLRLPGRKLGKCDGAVGTRNADAAIPKDEILRPCLQKLGGEFHEPARQHHARLLRR
jgi:hypothetical protein